MEQRIDKSDSKDGGIIYILSTAVIRFSSFIILLKDVLGASVSLENVD